MIIKDSFETKGIRPAESAPLLAPPRSRVTVALLLSLLVHALLLSLQFGVPGLGLPGLQLPWNERRAHAPALSVRIVSANQAPTPRAASAGTGPGHRPSREKPRLRMSSAAPARPGTGMKLLRHAEKTSNRTPPREKRKPAPASMTRNHKAVAASHHHRRKPSPAKPPPRLIAREQVTQDAFTVPFVPIDESKMREWATEVTKQEAQPAAVPQPDDEALALLREEARLERAREIEAQQREVKNARRQALELDARRQAEENARQQALELEARRQAEENARQQALELEARRQAEQMAQQQAAQQLEEENLRRARQIAENRLAEENARRQAEELEARRQAEQVAQQEAARKLEEESLQRARQSAARKLEEENARRQAAELEARRRGEEAAAQQAAAQARQSQADESAAAGNAQGQAPGPNPGAAATQGLEQSSGDAPMASGSGASGTPAQDDTAANTDDGPIVLSDSDLASLKVAQVRKVDATRLDPPAALEPADAQDSRRRTVFGSAEDDIALKMYLDSWRQAIERNGKPDQTQIRGDADVTVVVRSDGAIESITVNRSDGPHELDEMVRRIAQSQGPADAFPPDLLRRYDVIEIRRVWRFDGRRLILEEAR